MGGAIIIVDTVESLAEYFASLLVLRINETPAERPFSWVLSGGSTPKTIFRKIASSCRNDADWGRVRIFWGDERCVDPGDEESNFKMAKENLLDHLPVPVSNIYRIRGEEDPAAEAGRYADQFIMIAGQGHDIPGVDLMMLGLGEDGHTASIFPGNITLFNSDRLFEPSEHPVTRQKRITATGKIINYAKTVVIIATGESKASRVAQVIDKTCGWDQLPVSLVRPESGELIWLLDRQAASKPKLTEK